MRTIDFIIRSVNGAISKIKAAIPALGGPLYVDAKTGVPVARRFTHVIEVTAAMLTEADADTDQIIPLLAVTDGMVVEDVSLIVDVPFKDASDAALNDTKFSLGDGADQALYMAAAQVNENGTEVADKIGTKVRKRYATGDNVDLLAESMSGKSLVNIDIGHAYVLVDVWNIKTQELTPALAV